MVSIRVDGDCSAFNRVWFILVVLFNSIRGLWSGGGLLIVTVSGVLVV